MGVPDQVGLVFSIYSFASVAASPVLGRMVQLGYIKRRSLLLVGLLVVQHLVKHLFISSLTLSDSSLLLCWINLDP